MLNRSRSTRSVCGKRMVSRCRWSFRSRNSPSHLERLSYQRTAVLAHFRLVIRYYGFSAVALPVIAWFIGYSFSWR